MLQVGSPARWAIQITTGVAATVAAAPTCRQARLRPPCGMTSDGPECLTSDAKLELHPTVPAPVNARRGDAGTKMGLFSKHKGGYQKFVYFLHFHTLSWPRDAGSLCAIFHRGSHSGATRSSAGTSAGIAKDGPVTYVWEQQLQLPATLFEASRHCGSPRLLLTPAAPSRRHCRHQGAFGQQELPPLLVLQDVSAARKGSGKGLGPFEKKELKITMVQADKSGQPTGAVLGSVILNLADYASTDGRTQKAFSVAGAAGRSLPTGAGAPKLLLTIGWVCCLGCRARPPFPTNARWQHGRCSCCSRAAGSLSLFGDW